MPWQCSFKKIMLFCSNYAKNYASTIRQGLRLRANGRNNIQKCWELLVNTVASVCTQPKALADCASIIFGIIEAKKRIIF